MSYRAELRSRAHSAEQARRQVDVLADIHRRAFPRLARRHAPSGLPQR